MRPIREFQQVQLLIAAGLNDCAIARQTGIPRRTVQVWRSHPPKWDRERRAGNCAGVHDFDSLPRITTAICSASTSGRLYLEECSQLGTQNHRAARYPAIIDQCRASINADDARAPTSPFVQTLAMPVPQHGPGQASPADQAGTLAAGARESGDRGLRPRPDPQRRLPRHRRRPRRQEHPVPLHQPLRRHPRTVHRRPRSPRHPVDASTMYVVSVYRKAPPRGSTNSSARSAERHCLMNP